MRRRPRDGSRDKLCDAIADALVAEAIRREPRALVGVEVAVHRTKLVTPLTCWNTPWTPQKQHPSLERCQ
jgi:hypothetical protein